METEIQEGNNSKSVHGDSKECEKESQIGPEANQEESPRDDASDLERELSSALDEVEGLKNQNLRLVAEMDNLRKRQTRENSDLKKFANEKMLHDLLPVLDSLDKALKGFTVEEKQESPEDHDNKDSFIDGFQMVQKQMLECLKKHGLERVVATGSDFDPNLHQAIQRIESTEVDKDQVSEVFAEGYVLNGRLLRPSMVSVVVPATKKN